MNKLESPSQASALRRAIARIESVAISASAAGGASRVPLGAVAIDAAIGGGLMRGRLHEVMASEAEDAGSAAGFAAMLARRLGGGVVWLRQREAQSRGGALYAPGLVEIGLDPATLILALPDDPLALLRAAADVVRCPQVGVAVIELWRSPRALDLTATRRLALSAEASGVTPLLLRIDADDGPSAAQTRWSVCAAASSALEAGALEAGALEAGALEAGAPGHPAFDITLVRQRGAPAGGRWRVEWNRDRAEFSERAYEEGAALSGAPLPVAADRPAARVPARHAG